MLKSIGYSGKFALATGIIGFILGFIATDRGEMTPLILPDGVTGQASISGMLLFLALTLGFIVVGVAYRHNQDNDIIIDQGQQIVIERKQNWLVRILTAVASGLLLFVVTSAVVFLWDMVAPTYVADRILTLTYVTGYAVAVGFALSYWSSQIDSINLLILAGIAGTTGITVAALAVGDPLWWQNSLSYLGSTETAGIYFNIAIIITGLLVLAINQETILILHALADAKRLSADYVLSARVYLIVIPLCITGVGVFPTRIYPFSDFMHNVSSHFMLLFFVVMMLYTVNRKDSFHTRSFVMLSRYMALVIVGFVGLMVTGVINYVSFELLIFIPMGIWLLLYQLQVRDFAFKGAAGEFKAPRAQTRLAIYSLRAGMICIAVGVFLSLAFIPRVELSMEQVVDNEAPAIGDEVTFTLTINNAGPDIASAITTRQVTLNGYDEITVEGDGDYDAERDEWNLKGLGVGESASLTLVGTLAETTDGAEDTSVGLAPGDPQNMVLFIGRDSGVTVSAMLIVLAVVLGISVTGFAYRRFVLEDPDLSEIEREALIGRSFFIPRIVVALTSGVILFAVTLVGLFIMNSLAPNVFFSTLNVIAIVAVYSGVIGFALAYWAGNMKTTSLIILAGLIFIVGILLGAWAMGDPDWWTISLSYLGSTENSVMGFFNFATLFTGFVLLIVNFDSIGILKVMRQHNLVSHDLEKMVRWILILMPFGLIGVALFPRRINNVYNLIHNMSAMVMILLFMILAFYVVARKDSIFNRTFIRISQVLAVSVPILFIAYVLEIITYVGMELYLMIPIGLWLIFFQVELRSFARQNAQGSPPVDDINSPAPSPA